MIIYSLLIEIIMHVELQSRNLQECACFRVFKKRYQTILHLGLEHLAFLSYQPAGISFHKLGKEHLMNPHLANRPLEVCYYKYITDCNYNQ